MMNDYNQKYEAPIKLGLEDPNENVREFSRSVCSKLQYRFKAWEDVMDVVD